MRLIYGFFWIPACRGRSKTIFKSKTEGKGDAKKMLVLIVTFNNHFACRTYTRSMEIARRNAYDAAFKLKAIDLSVQKGNRAAARKLGVNESMIRRWRQQHEELTQCKKTTKAFRGHKNRCPKGNVLEDWAETQRADSPGTIPLK